MPKKIRLNLDELKVQSFVTTLDANEQAAMYGAVVTGPLVCPTAGACGSLSLRCQSVTCDTALRCETTDCSIGNTDDFTCVPQTTYCTQYEPQNCRV